MGRVVEISNQLLATSKHKNQWIKMSLLKLENSSLKRKKNDSQTRWCSQYGGPPSAIQIASKRSATSNNFIILSGRFRNENKSELYDFTHSGPEFGVFNYFTT